MTSEDASKTTAVAGQRQPGAKHRGGLMTAVLWAVTCLLILCTLALVAVVVTRTPSSPDLQPKRLVDVEVIEVVPCEYFETLVLPARLQADRGATISSELNGRLERWFVGEGHRVEAGQAIAALNTDELEARLAQQRATKDTAEKQVELSRIDVARAQVALEQTTRDAAALSLELQSAEANRELAEKEYRRIDTLASSNISPPAELDAAANNFTQATIAVSRAKDAIERARIGVEAAAVQVAQAEAALGLAVSRIAESERAIGLLDVTLEKAILNAPFAGHLEEHLVEPGEVVAAGQELARIYDSNYVRAIIDVADRYVPFLDESNRAVADYVTMAMPGAEPMLRVKVIVPGLPKLVGSRHAGLEFEAEVARVAQAADKAGSTFKVELRLPNPGGALREGMIVRAHVQYLRYREAIVIPLRAVQVADIGPRVLVVDKRQGSDIAFARDIEPVSIQGERLLVSSGLQAGERLIVAGGRGVLDGEQVNVVKEDGLLVLAGSFEQASAQPLDPAIPTVPSDDESDAVSNGTAR